MTISGFRTSNPCIKQTKCRLLNNLEQADIVGNVSSKEDGLSFILEWVYVFVFFRIWYSFLPLRKNRIMKILAVIPFGFMAVCVIYSNELTNLTFLLIGMIVYVIVFHRGAWVEKATAVLIFYPALVAVNYLMLDSGMKFFYFYSGLPYGEDSALHPETLLSSTVIHTMTLLFRLLFWIGAGAF